MTNASVVRVRGLKKSYRGRVVVDDFDLDVAEGEVVGLIGANGAGKTTVVECAQGLRRPDAGSLRVLGFDPATERDSLRDLIGSQLQSSALPDRLRVTEAVQLFGGRHGYDLLEQFGLMGRGRAAFGSLSGGERQRLFLVLALVNSPRLVILDELTQGLDPAARRNVWEAVDQLRAGGTAVLLVTHELDEAERLCDRVVAMRAGRVLASGSPAQLVDRYGAWTRITFSLPPGRPGGAGLDAAGLASLPGVSAVDHEGGRVAITAERSAIAHVGAALVGAGWYPPDLVVRVPTLEDALVDLLEHDGAERVAELSRRQLAGAER
jgi:ABC-2 type transport system ATP-binding protein